jgi:hypothetical protein
MNNRVRTMGSGSNFQHGGGAFRNAAQFKIEPDPFFFKQESLFEMSVFGARLWQRLAVTQQQASISPFH